MLMAVHSKIRRHVT